MSAELAVPDDGALPTAEVARQIAQLRKAQEYVRSAPEAEALGAKRQAALAREWARINKASEKIAVEASRLQLIAVRRLGQLKSSLLTAAERKPAEWLASMPDDEFGKLLAKSINQSPVGVYRDHIRREELNRSHERGRAIGRGEGTPRDYESVQAAAHHLLYTAMTSGGTSVYELTEKLAEHLEIDLHSGVDQYVLREGVETVIREALRNECCSDDDDGGHPEFVTWNDEVAGWLRIPWGAAALHQLRWMADYRQEQARELQSAADELTKLASALEQLAGARPGLARLPELWRVYRGKLEDGDAA